MLTFLKAWKLWALLGAVTVAGIGGYKVAAWRYQAQLATLEQAHAEAVSQAERAARDTLAKAHARDIKALQALLDQERAALAAQSETIAALEGRAAATRVVYINALETDPDCKAWAAMSIACPISWMRDDQAGAGATGGD